MQARLQTTPAFKADRLQQAMRPQKVADLRVSLPKVSQRDVEEYDWEAFDYAAGITQTVAEQCLSKISSFQDLFSAVNIQNIPADKYADIAVILPTLLAVPSTPEHQDEYLGRLGHLAEILGNQDIINCIDAVKSYNYDVQMAASQQSAAAGASANITNTVAPGSSTAVVPASVVPAQAPPPPLWKKLIRPWYSKVLLVGLLGGAGWYGYSVLTKNKKKDDELDLGTDDEDLLEEDEETVIIKKTSNPLPRIRLNPKKPRKKSKRKAKTKRK